jgi:Fe2+ transport system protein FeoA
VESAYLKKDLIPLAMFPRNTTAEVAVVRAGWGLQRRLADMGILPGIRVKIISGGRPGPVAIEVRGSKLMLGHGVANKIMVVPGEITQK